MVEPSIGIVDYRRGNLQSVVNAFEAIGETTRIINDPQALSDVAAVVLPGVGAFGDGMRNLNRLGFVDALREEVIGKRKPFLGICLGMQLIAETGLEGGHHRGLGWLPATVKKIVPSHASYKVPHMGWNDLAIERESKLLAKLEEDPVVFFVHSYHLEMDDPQHQAVIATCWHGTQITAGIQQGNIMGVQFHPEKSQQVGLQILRNFANFAHQEEPA